MLLGAIGGHVLAGGMGGQFGGRSMFVGGADIKRLPAPGPLEARIDVGRQHGADQIAEMLDAVDIGQCAGDESTCHKGAA